MTSRKPSAFKSSLAPYMDQFVREKRAVGYRYDSGTYILTQFDRFLAREAPNDETLTRTVTRKWLAKGLLESGANQQHRFTVARQFALFLCRLGHPAYVPDGSLRAKHNKAFSPRILTHAEVRRILREADRLAPTAMSPLRHVVMPEVFRLLYGCGFRVSEVLKLRVADADLNRGILTVRDGKFGKDRHVPSSPAARPTTAGLRRRNRPAQGQRILLRLGSRWPVAQSHRLCAVSTAAVSRRHSTWRPGQGPAGPRPEAYVRCPYHASLVPRGREPRCEAARVGDVSGPSVTSWNPALSPHDGRVAPGSRRPHKRQLRRRHSSEGQAMKPTDFSVQLTNYLTRHLASQRNLSPNTIRAYRDGFSLFLRFCRDQRGIALERLRLKNMDVELVEAFLDHLETDRRVSIRTQNQRLAMLHSFFRYVQSEAPHHLVRCQRILAIPLRRQPRKLVGYLSKEELADILAQPDLRTRSGRRDAVLLSLLYDTGARVQELIDLSAGDVRLDPPAQVRLFGKGRKIRAVPLMDPTTQLLRDHLRENGLDRPEKSEHPVFENRQEGRLTRWGIRYILDKYVQTVRNARPGFTQPVTPHTLRHYVCGLTMSSDFPRSPSCRVSG